MFEIAILTAVLLVVFILVGWYAHKRSQQKLWSVFDKVLPTEDIDNGFGQLFSHEMQQEMKGSSESGVDSEPTVSLSSTAVKPQSKTINTPTPKQALETSSVQSNLGGDEIITFAVMAQGSGLFLGKKIKVALDKLDMQFGELQIYHCYKKGQAGQTLFSVANILDPGTLNPDAFETMTTPGLLIFAHLSGPVNGLTLFDDLLVAAKKLATQLTGVLCDEKRRPISNTALEKMRGRILDFNLTMQSENSQYPNDYSD